MTARIDAHQHFWRVDRGDYFWLTPALKPLYRDFGPADLAPLVKATGIEATIIVQAAQTLAETRYMLDIAGETDWITGVVGWIDFESPSAADDLAELGENPKLVGVRPMIQDIADDDWMLRPDLDPAFLAVEESGLVFDALVFPRHLKNLLKRLAQHPNMRVVIDHCAKPRIAEGLFDGWAADMAELAHETQAYCKISGLVSEAGKDWSVNDLRPYFDHVAEHFEPRRLVFGSDWPVCTLVADYQRWVEAAEELSAGFSSTEKEILFGGNAISLYGLGEPGRLGEMDRTT